MKNKLLIQKIKKLKFISLEDNLKYELYSIFTSMILSKEIFKRNIEIKKFLREMNLDIKDYIVRSRTNILSKTLKYINTRDMNELREISNFLINFIDGYIKNENENENENYTRKILSKYAREQRDE